MDYSNLKATELATSSISKTQPLLQYMGIFRWLASLLTIIGLIVGILYMFKSKKSKGKRILIGLIIIIVPFILNYALTFAQIYMQL